ncbi:MAG: ABC transporter permease [Proteobacteria bacterium]|nr:ABC transporter permease [Pseudomonadota bacterium]
MGIFIVKRIITSLFVLLGASFLTYGMMMLAPGDAALEIAVARYGGEDRVDAETIDWIREQEGLSKPFIHQYARWLKHVVMLDLGRSMVDGAPVLSLIRQRFSRTLELVVAAISIALVVSLPLGILAGMKRGTWLDSLCASVSVIGVSMPNYWLGIILIVVFCVRLKLLPAFGRGDITHIILPSITLGTAMTAYTTKILRNAVIETRQSDFYTALKARGLGKRPVLFRHLMKNALIPVVTVIGIELGMLLEGAVITETVFAWPGIGELMVTAISNRDYPLIQGIVLFSATVFIVINFIVDMLYYFLDPRIRMT